MEATQFQFLEGQALASVSSAFRQELLRSLATPASATEIARRHGMSRQRVGYHMRDLERAGCIAVVGERQQRGLKEKLYQVLPRVFTCAPITQQRPARRRDRFSFANLVHVLGRSLWELGRLRALAQAAGKRTATLTLEAQLHFENPRQRKAFTEDLLDAVEGVIRRHERTPTDATRAFRLVLGAFPKLDPAQFREGERKESNNDR